MPVLEKDLAERRVYYSQETFGDAGSIALPEPQPTVTANGWWLGYIGFRTFEPVCDPHDILLEFIRASRRLDAKTNEALHWIEQAQLPSGQTQSPVKARDRLSRGFSTSSFRSK